MSDGLETPAGPRDGSHPGGRSPRLPSARASAVLAAGMLAAGIAVGAAIGPAPESSLAGDAGGIAQRLPQLLAVIAARTRAPAPSPAGAPASVQSESGPPPALISRRRRVKHVAATSPTAAAAPTPASAEAPSPAPTSHRGSNKKLPPLTGVWLIELAGTGFARALEQPAAAPFIAGQLLPSSTFLSSWSALGGSALASEAALAEPVASGAPPPLLHSIVQPPCPEGPAGALCAPETTGQLTAADEFLKATLAQITPTAAYREHGLIVVIFATVGIAAQASLPAGASTATLTAQPPGGVVLLSPFAHAGAKPAVSFNPTSPRQSLEALLH